MNTTDRKDAPMGNKTRSVTWVATTTAKHMATADTDPAERIAAGPTAALAMLRDLADLRDERLRDMAERRLDRFDGPDINVVVDDPQTLLDDPQIRQAVDALIRYGHLARIHVAVDTAHAP